MTRLQGLGVSAGVAYGRALVLKHSRLDLRLSISESDIEREVGRLDAARELSMRQLVDVKARVAGVAGPEHGYLFDAQLLMLDDPMLVPRAAELIRTEQLNAEWAVQRAFDELTAVFESVADSYLRERQGDVSDVVGRLRLNLRGGAPPMEFPRDRQGTYVLIADGLAPSVAAQLDWQRVAGFATDAGSWTHHTAILARALGIPAVAGLRGASRVIPPSALVAIDGDSGTVLVDPPQAMVDELRSLASRRVHPPPRGSGGRPPTATADGCRVDLQANIELPDELSNARAFGAVGIGLYRSEYLAAREALDVLSEDEQCRQYSAMLDAMAPGPVTVRTFDVGEDQIARQRDAAGAARIRRGLPAIRLSLARPDLFRRQLRALLRAATHGRLRIMFPSISSLEDLRQAREVLREAAQELRARGESVPDVPVGIMIEVPSAALTADLLAREADFFSIGTNDLIQYCLAVDRTDDHGSHLDAPLNPAILRLVRRVERAARRHDLPLALCGEMAADPRLMALLVGLGIRTFSMTPSAIPRAHDLLAGVRLVDLRALAARALRCSTAGEVDRLLTETPGIGAFPWTRGRANRRTSERSALEH